MREVITPHYFAICPCRRWLIKVRITMFGLEAHMTWNNTLFLPRTSLWTRKRDGYTLYFDTEGVCESGLSPLLDTFPLFKEEFSMVG